MYVFTKHQKRIKVDRQLKCMQVAYKSEYIKKNYM